MHVFHRLEEFSPASASPDGRTVVAIGNFDGVHLGHGALLGEAREDARKRRTKLVVLTFYPHPVEVLRPGTKLARLTTASEKLALLEAIGADVVLVQPFDAELARVSPDSFFERFLLRGLSAASVHVGFNFRFGHARQGDTASLKKLGDRHGIAVQIAKPFLLEGTPVSSSAIRRLIAEGQTLEASKGLGRPYSVYGQVAHGDHRGTALGFPTANVAFPDDKVLPKNGVYVTRASWQRQAFRAVANIGVRPTFEAGKPPAPRLEVHLLDFNTRLYDEFLQVEFLERIRDEMRFSSLDALKEQIRADVEVARASPQLRRL